MHASERRDALRWCGLAFLVVAVWGTSGCQPAEAFRLGAGNQDASPSPPGLSGLGGAGGTVDDGGAATDMGMGTGGGMLGSGGAGGAGTGTGGSINPGTDGGTTVPDASPGQDVATDSNAGIPPDASPDTGAVAPRPWAPLVRSGWTVTASAGANASNMKDGRRSTVWSSGINQASGQNIVIDLGSAQTFGGITMQSTTVNEIARGYDIYVSATNGAWDNPIASGTGTGLDVEISFADQTARYIKIQLNTAQASSWQVAEVFVWGTTGSTMFPTKGMTASASASTGGSASNAIDGNYATRWSPGTPQTNGQWLKLDLGGNRTVTGLTLDAYDATNDQPRSYKVDVSTDNAAWTTVASGTPTVEFLHITFSAHTARYVMVTQIGGDIGNWWSVYEFRVLGTPPAN